MQIEQCKNCGRDIESAGSDIWRHIEPTDTTGGHFVFLCFPDEGVQDVFAEKRDPLSKLIIQAELNAKERR